MAKGLLATCVAVLVAALGCDHGNDEARARVRRNLSVIEDYLWKEMSELNRPTFRHGHGRNPPTEIGRHAAGAFMSPARPRGAMEKLLATTDGLVHEQYDVACDTVGFMRWGSFQPALGAGMLGAAYWHPRWMTVEARAATGPHGAVECTRRRVSWEDIGSATNATYTVLIEQSEARRLSPHLVRTEGSCPAP